MKTENEFPALLEAFFTDRLCHQRRASPHTIASYRDTFRLLLAFAGRRLKKAPSALTITDLDTPFLGTFLDHLERERGNTARSRNVRLAALHSFFRYVGPPQARGERPGATRAGTAVETVSPYRDSLFDAERD